VSTLAWEGCANVRDLGGFQTEEGARTVEGAIVRADSIAELSAAGWAALVGHGISRIVDLRFHEERDADPPRGLSVDVVHVSLLGELDLDYAASLEERILGAPDVADYLRDSYLDFLERYREQFGRAVAAVADAPPGAVLIHCQGGKDRTGLVTALLLRLVGVRVEDVAEDYAASEANLANAATEWIAEADDERSREWRRRISRAPSRAMLEVVNELEHRYGSVADYLRAAGLSDEQLHRLRERLLA
jgi:protein-tyrosine phosphatase